jgi:hypothetical protein
VKALPRGFEESLRETENTRGDRADRRPKPPSIGNGQSFLQKPLELRMARLAEPSLLGLRLSHRNSMKGSCGDERQERELWENPWSENPGRGSGMK